MDVIPIVKSTLRHYQIQFLAALEAAQQPIVASDMAGIVLCDSRAANAHIGRLPVMPMCHDIIAVIDIGDRGYRGHEADQAVLPADLAQLAMLDIVLPEQEMLFVLRNVEIPECLLAETDTHSNRGPIKRRGKGKIVKY
jgi:hypothetical protein